ncbi:WYL domain-containing protein [Propionivibrio sp.]|uniref:WYL domain-containing protein n=1 Tax=Propionivibrio sp. TaxID=2212460 RepID=UPI003BF3FB38
MNLESSSADASLLTQTQRERLAYIDYKVFFSGELRRADLESRFGIAQAAATRDLTCYRGLAPGNLVYDASAKLYTISDRFAPIYPIATERALAWLRQGYGDGLTLCIGRQIPTDGADLLAPPPIDTIATIARAIHRRLALKIRYQSLSSGASVRDVVPLALVDNGMRWHVRAYDRKNSRFGDFVINRISSLETANASVAAEETLAADGQWNQLIQLDLVVHPGLSHPKAIEADYGITGGVLTVRVRAAVAGYALVRWNVDCSPNHSLDPHRHHLWLRNQEVLNGVESAMLGPGYPRKVGTDAPL